MAIACASHAAGEEAESADAPVAPPLPLPEPAGYTHWVGGIGIGNGLRLNNPFRLSQQLGDDAQSLSRTAVYFTSFAGVAFGAPNGLQHGGAVNLDAALDGIGQQTLTPAYLLLYRAAPPLWLRGRIGMPVVLTPDVTGGVEGSFGMTWLFTAGIGLYADLVGSVFYGAATYDQDVTTIPILSLQLGTTIDFEVLP